ncbi:hypothetical protein ALNOE001_09510 [Candidatus Methanobinarius endosymbioticus]|uniref:Uncharacterized protein n=1 Tax=Candidatus Methanobinarius endosymbioticus TaxID=2006182 RepID=A0A366MD06_9EURY|nr:hypothetical protein ALNOE001_09510 [Candidatus Methanobinarius endosymbioticus]
MIQYEKKLDKVVKHKSLLLFAGGAILAIAAKKIFGSDSTKKFCVKTAAKIIELRDQAEKAFQDVKDNVEDIRF